MNLKTLLVGLLLILFLGKINGQLTADFTADVVAGCVPIRVVFTDNSTGGATDWKWDLGNGTIAEKTSNPSTTYLVSGTYTVKLTVYNGTDSAKITKTNFITVYPTPVVNFGALPLLGCLPFQVQFRDSSIIGGAGVPNFQWDFGDGNIATGQNPVHFYTNPGSYKVTLTVKNGSGCINTVSRLNYITVFDSISAQFGIVAPASCTVPATYKFNDSSTGAGIIAWNWDFGDGGTSILKNPTHVYGSKGSYTVRLIIQNINGCLDTLVKTNAIASGNFTTSFTSSASGCIGKAVSFTNTSTPASLVDSSRWSFGDGKFATTFNSSHSYNTTGNFKVKLVTWFGSCSDSSEKTITVAAAPVANFTASPTVACQPPLDVQFTNQTTGGTVVKWNFGNGQTSTSSNPSVTYSGYGRFNVSLIVQNGNGCMDTLVQRDFVVIEKPRITTIAGLPFQGCMPWTNTFSVGLNNNSQIAKYEWDFGDGTKSGSAKPTHTFTDTTEYKVKVIITTVDGCTDTAYSSVHGGLKPKANFVASPTWICPLDPVSYTNLSSGIANSFYWEFGDGGTSEDANPTYLYMDTGYMTVSLVAYNNGCADTFFIPDYIYVNPPIARFRDTSYCGDPYRVFFTDNSKGGKYWQWFINETDSIETKDLEYVFPDTGSYKVRLYIRDSLCDHHVSRIIRIIDEKAAFIAADSGSCGKSYKIFTVAGPRTNPANIVRYRWDFGDGKTLTTDTPVVVHPYTMTGTVNVRLIITDIMGCNDTVISPVTIKLYGPRADFGPPISRVCAGSPVTFTDSTEFDPVNPIINWRWNFGDGNTVDFTNSPFTNVYMDAGVYDVKMVVEDSGGCKDSILRKNAVVVYKPIAGFFSADTLICVNSPVKFVNTSEGVSLSSRWDFGNGKTSSVSQGLVTYDSIGKYDIQLVVTDSLNCTDTLAIPLYISVENAIADFSVSDVFTTCPPLVVDFTNNSRYNILNNWSFGNGNSSSLSDPSHTYTTPGVFMVTLTVTGNGGCKDSATKKIEIQGPYGDFSYSPLGGCPPLVVNFVTHPKNTKHITYDFSDGLSTILSDTTTKHTYVLPGTFVPKVIFADDLGCKIAIQGLDTIRVIGAKAYIRSLPTYKFCDSTSINFFDSTITLDVIKSFKWDFGDGTTSFVQNPVHDYKKEGRYTVIFEVQTMSGCISRDTLNEQVIIARTPHIEIGPDSAACVPASIRFGANWLNKDTSTLVTKWVFGNGQSSDLFSPAPVFYDRPGNFPVSFVVSNRYGCGDSSYKLVTINDSPRVVAGPASYICLGKSVTLSASGGITYNWDSHPSLSCLNCQNPVATPASQQVYRATATDANGCKASNTVTVKVKPPPLFKFGPGDTLCVGQSLQLEASGTERYIWSPNTGLSSTTIPNPVAKPLATTNYMVVGYDTLGCFADTGYLNVVVYPIPVFNILEEKIAALSGTIIPIETSSSTDITRWHWSPPAGLSCTNCAAPLVTVGIPVTYTAVASNPGNCRVEDKVTIIPVCDAKNVFIPNTFSPNGDGQNDVFFPHGRGLNLVKSMRIFSRWGELLFEQKDFAFNNPASGWDGTYKGVRLTPDVYVYMIEVLCDNNETFSLKGNVTLIR